jgi:exodeoxyribonuclease-3
MRLVTWNCCRGPYVRKASFLEALAPDVAVIQECARPSIETDQCLWFGDNPRQGIAVFANGQYRIRALPTVPDVPRYAIPIEVAGPTNFLLIAVWSKGGKINPYVEGVVRAVELYRDLFSQYRTVLLGDLNSNAIWDSNHAAGLNHSALVKILSELGLVSSYHVFHREAHGEEKQPTYYFQWKKGRPFHIDYCFIPKDWAPNVQRVEVGSYAKWRARSDHRPLLVEVADVLGDC